MLFFANFVNIYYLSTPLLRVCWCHNIYRLQGIKLDSFIIIIDPVSFFQ